MFSCVHNPNRLTDDELAMFLSQEEDDFRNMDEILPETQLSDAEEDHVSEDDTEDDIIISQPEENSNEDNTFPEPQQQTFFTKDANIQWSKVPLCNARNRSKVNIITTPQGLTQYSSDISSISEAFHLLITPDIINIIVTETNRKGNDFIRKWNDAHPNDVKSFEQTNEIEIKAYIGLLLILGALQANKEPVEMLWTSDRIFCRRIVPACMSKHRYKTLTSFLRLKIWALADCENAYILNMQVYLGKEGRIPEKNQGLRVVLDLTEHLQGGYGITTDNFFTSLQLAEALRKRNLTLCGTLIKNKPYIPNELLPKTYKHVHSSMFSFRSNCTLVSYIPKKNRAIILLSSEHMDEKVSGIDDKPDIILHYNDTKGAVDTGDKLAKQYSTKRKSNRWPMIMFYHLLDIAAINSYKLWTNKYPTWGKTYLDRRRRFLLELGKNLVKEHIIYRYENVKSLNKDTKQHMESVFLELRAKNENANEPVPGASTSGRCSICPRNKDSKTRKMCDTCHSFVCQIHSNQVVKCQRCYNK